MHSMYMQILYLDAKISFKKSKNEKKIIKIILIEFSYIQFRLFLDYSPNLFLIQQFSLLNSLYYSRMLKFRTGFNYKD